MNRVRRNPTDLSARLRNADILNQEPMVTGANDVALSEAATARLNRKPVLVALT